MGEFCVKVFEKVYPANQRAILGWMERIYRAAASRALCSPNTTPEAAAAAAVAAGVASMPPPPAELASGASSAQLQAVPVIESVDSSYWESLFPGMTTDWSWLDQPLDDLIVVDMAPFTYLITGATRSLGLGYTRALLASRSDVRVVACARNPASASDLNALAAEAANAGRVHVLQVNVEDAAQVQRAADELASSGFLGPSGALDALINNAGVALKHDVLPSQLDAEDVLANLRINVFGVLNVTKAFLPLLRKGTGKQIFSVSSMCGSIEVWGGNTSTAAYSLSKVALNMYSEKLATELGPEGFTVVVFHPGYVKTDMNHGAGEITVEEAADAALKNVFLKVTPAENGAFLRYSGEKMPW
ncbi:hypothetical protein JCM3770_004226 [Rhodotorula araucariae]